MGNYVVEFSDGRVALPSATQIIVADAKLVSQISEWFGADWTCLYDKAPHPIAAGWPGCTNFHHNPRPSTVVGRLGPYMNELPGVEQLGAAVTGATVLVLRSLGGDVGEGWFLGRVVADMASVLADGNRLIPADAVAVAVSDRESVPGLDFVVSHDGSPWRLPKKGAPVRLPSFHGPLSTVGELAAAGAQHILVQVAPAPSPKWEHAQVNA